MPGLNSAGPLRGALGNRCRVARRLSMEYFFNKQVAIEALKAQIDELQAQIEELQAEAPVSKCTAVIHDPHTSVTGLAKAWPPLPPLGPG